MLPPWPGVSQCWECHKLPGRCQHGHREATGEKKTSPKPKLVWGLYGIDPPTPPGARDH